MDVAIRLATLGQVMIGICSVSVRERECVSRRLKPDALMCFLTTLPGGARECDVARFFRSRKDLVNSLPVCSDPRERT